MRPQTGRAPVEILIEAGFERLHRGRLAAVTSFGILEAELRSELGEARPGLGHGLDPRGDESSPSQPPVASTEPAHLARRPQRSPAAGVALANSCPVLGGNECARRIQPSERPVEVRTPGRRAAFDDREPVRREHKRRELAAELLGGAQSRPFNVARFASVAWRTISDSTCAPP